LAFDDEETAHIVRVASRIAYAVYTLVFFSIVAAFGVGVFFARTDSRLSVIEAKITDLPPSWVLKDIERLHTEDLRLQLQIDRLEGHPGRTYAP
jgi:hypothetical protein